MGLKKTPKDKPLQSQKKSTLSFKFISRIYFRVSVPGLEKTSHRELQSGPV